MNRELNRKQNRIQVLWYRETELLSVNIILTTPKKKKQKTETLKIYIPEFNEN